MWLWIILVLVLVATLLSLNHFYGLFILHYPTFDDTYVSLRFDDGWDSQYNAYILLKEYNMTGSIYVITNFMGEERYLTWEQVKELSSIMEIGTHTRTHADLPVTEDLEYELKGSYDDCVGRGFNVTTFVYPYGNYNKKVVDVIKKYYKCASTQDVGINTKNTDLYLLRDFTIRSRNSLEDIKKVIKPQAWTILTFHDVGEIGENEPSYIKDNAVSEEFFEGILKFLKENDIRVITVSEGCNMLENEDY